MISSVTDPYQPIERKYKLMKRILENLILLQPDLCLMAKSDLITKDIDLLKKFKKGIIKRTKNFVLVKEYQEIYFTKNDYWARVEKEIKDYSRKNNLNFKIHFHHRKTLA